MLRRLKKYSARKGLIFDVSKSKVLVFYRKEKFRKKENLVAI